MTIEQILKVGIEGAIKADPRGPAGVVRHMTRVKKRYEKMSPKEREYFDPERLTNPYPDSTIHVLNGKNKIKRVLAGIDITSSEILLASQLEERDKPIDLVISHHPAGRAIANLHEVMDLAVDVYENLGMPVHMAEKITEERMRDVSRGTHRVNQYQVVDVARLLEVNFMTTHTLTDNLVNDFIKTYLEKKKPATVEELMDVLLELPEYHQAKKMAIGPKILSGSPNHRIGKFFVDMTGGTNPAARVYEELSNYGISTIVGMHMPDDSVQKATERQLNVIIAGHMPSDSLGMNLFLDQLEKQGVEIVPCGGLIRVSRNNKTSKKK